MRTSLKGKGSKGADRWENRRETTYPKKEKGGKLGKGKDAKGKIYGGLMPGRGLQFRRVQRFE